MNVAAWLKEAFTKDVDFDFIWKTNIEYIVNYEFSVLP